MKVQEHIGKISWSIGDKILFILYGFVNLYQASALGPEEYSYFVLLLMIHTFIFMINDSLALQGLIQFGSKAEEKPRTNLIALSITLIVTLILSLIFYSLRFLLYVVFETPELILVGEYLPLLTLVTIPKVFGSKILAREHKINSMFFSNLAFFLPMGIMTFYLVELYDQFLFQDMIFIYFIGSIISSIITLLLVGRELKFSVKGLITLKEYFTFSSPLTLNSMFNAIPKYLDAYIILYIFNPTVVGIYHLAKTLYRVFDEAASAAYALIYPPAVRLISKDDWTGLHSLMTKAVSFMFVFFLIVVLFIQIGLGDLVISTLLPKYIDAIPLLESLSWAALAIPFTLLSYIIMAMGDTIKILKYVTAALILSLFAFIVVGYTKDSSLIPLTIISYNFTFGILCYFYVKRNIGFRIKDLFRAVRDSKHYFIKS